MRPASSTPRRRATVTALVGLDAFVLVLGTFWVWLLLGLAEGHEPVPDWIAPAATLLGLGTVALGVAVVAARVRDRPTRAAAGLSAALHVALAVAAASALGSMLGAATLLLGASALLAARR